MSRLCVNFCAVLGLLTLHTSSALVDATEPPRTRPNVREKIPASARPVYDDAKAKFDAGDSVGALALVEKLAAQEPKSAPVQALAGEAAIHAGKYELALQYSKRAVELDPKLKYAWSVQANVYSRLARSAEEEAAYSKQLELDPADADVRYARAVCRRERGKHEAALQDIIEVRKTRDDRDALLAHLLICYDNLLFDAAQEPADKLVQAHPDYARGRMFRAVILVGRGREAEADKEFAKAVELDPAMEFDVASYRGQAREYRAKALEKLKQAPAPRPKP